MLQRDMASLEILFELGPRYDAKNGCLGDRVLGRYKSVRLEF